MRKKTFNLYWKYTPPSLSLQTVQWYIYSLYMYTYIYTYIIYIGSGIISNTNVTENTQQDVCRFYPVIISFYTRDFNICGLWCSWETHRCHHFKTVMEGGPGSKFTLAWRNGVTSASVILILAAWKQHSQGSGCIFCCAVLCIQNLVLSYNAMTQFGLVLSSTSPAFKGLGDIYVESMHINMCV